MAKFSSYGDWYSLLFLSQEVQPMQNQDNLKLSKKISLFYLKIHTQCRYLNKSIFKVEIPGKSQVMQPGSEEEASLNKMNDFTL